MSHTVQIRPILERYVILYIDVILLSDVMRLFYRPLPKKIRPGFQSGIREVGGQLTVTGVEPGIF